MKLFAFVALALLPLAPALPTSAARAITERATIQQITDTLLFIDTIAQFEAARNARNPASLDWSSDNCSDSPDNPFGFNFVPPCHRHDFGYRNYKKQGRFNDAAKDEIDENFKHDMYNVCNRESLVKRTACKGVANIYYAAVQEFGSKKRAIQVANERLGERAVLQIDA